MNTVTLPLAELSEAPWNANTMDEKMFDRLQESVRRYGLVENLVVRRTGQGYEVLSGNQRLRVLRALGHECVPCVVVDLDDANARLLAQALNRIQGEDDLGRKAALMKDILEELPQEDVISILPESACSLESLATLGSIDLASYLQNWDLTRSARLRHLQFQLTAQQLEVVEEALGNLMSRARREKGDSPNLRGTALYLLCKKYLESERDGR